MDNDGNPVNVRIVGMDTVVSTIYKCKNETMVVKVIKRGFEPIVFDSSEDKGTLNEKIQKFVDEAYNTLTTGSIFGEDYERGLFLEQFAEVRYSGKEITEDDGSSIIVSKGGSKMYITYELLDELTM